MNSGTENTNQAARTAIQKIAGTYKLHIIDVLLASVISVDERDRTCEVTAISGQGEVDLTVSLTPDRNDGEVKIPSVGSTVGVLISKELKPFIIAWSDLDKIVWKGGEYNGLVKVVDLVNKLNAIENLLNSFISKYNVHIHPASSGTTSATVSQESGVLTQTQKSDIENPLITHGGS